MPETILRTAELRQMLMERRREMLEHVQGDMDLAVLQMHAETARRIEDALARLDANM